MSEKKQIPPSRLADQFVVRFPDGMRDKIAEAAKSNGRSMNAEIIAVLQERYQGGSFDVGQPVETMNLDDAIDAAMNEYERRQRELLHALFVKYGIRREEISPGVPFDRLTHPKGRR